MSDATDTVVAKVTGNLRVTEVGREYDTHHIVLDLGKTPFPALEGQSIGVVAPGVDASGRPHRFAGPRSRSMAAGLRNGRQTRTTGPDRLCRDPI